LSTVRYRELRKSSERSRLTDLPVSCQPVRGTRWTAAPRIAGVLMLVEVVAVCACAAHTATPAAVPEAERQGETGMLTYDDLLLQVDKQAQGFGGMFVDSDGRLAVYVLNTTRLAATRAAIESVFGSNHIPAAGIRAIQGQYSISQLKTWTERASRLLSVPGVTIVDMDERRNRVVVGIDGDDRRRTVSRELSSLKVPPNAVLLEVVAPIKPVGR